MDKLIATPENEDVEKIVLREALNGYYGLLFVTAAASTMSFISNIAELWLNNVYMKFLTVELTWLEFVAVKLI